MLKISETMKALRLEYELTQKDLAAQLNIGQATIAGYESGSREPHIASLIAYAEFFDCSLDYLVGRTDELGAPLKNNAVHPNDEEIEILKKFRSLSKTDKARLNGYLDALKNNQTKK